MTDRSGREPTLVLAVGDTRTSSIPDISAAGADPAARRWTPVADAEILATGAPVGAPTFPKSPSGCPTPAVVTRAVRELVGFEVVVIDAGTTAGPGVETVDACATPGGDVREEEPVADAPGIFERARAIGGSLDCEELLLAESIPGGTTTAMGVLAALGERTAVSSSLPDNPRERKQSIVEEGLDASEIGHGDLDGRPREAVRRMGDPVLASLVGLAMGCSSGTDLTLAGGTQLACVGALLRHADVERPLTLATTSYVAGDDSANVEALARDLSLDLCVTDPRFDELEDGRLDRFAAGEAKEGVGMGGALELAARRDVSMQTVAAQATAVVERGLAGAR